ncbi:hypothetical protein UC35_15940 [Ramlibacter tataouinensis]|uniref:Uncharacterized protein n=1 Tax=Ramlibacter tataouinensis TaxID=94132 RepID=A0A127JVM3_9BURK|nr:hypothetical protein UC35_15940 [Ramlibacter tataouinensis]
MPSGGAWSVVAAALLVAACSHPVPLEPVSGQPPLVRRTDARVGIVYAGGAGVVTIGRWGHYLEVGQASVAHFDQAFATMFSEVTPLPNSPAWRELGTPLDGVMEVQRTDATLENGNNFGRREGARPDVVRIGYRICLFEPSGVEVRCWSPTATETRQRESKECERLELCWAALTQAAMRSAIARFLVDAQSDPAMLAWAARLRSGGTRP